MSSKKAPQDDLVASNADLQRRISQLETIVSAQLQNSQLLLTELSSVKEKLDTQVTINESNNKYFTLLHKELNYYKSQNTTLELQLHLQRSKQESFEKDVTEWLYYLYRHQQKQFDYVNQTFLPPLARAFPDWIRSLLQKQQQTGPSSAAATGQSGINGPEGGNNNRKVGSISGTDSTMSDPTNTPSTALSTSTSSNTTSTSSRNATAGRNGTKTATAAAPASASKSTTTSSSRRGQSQSAKTAKMTNSLTTASLDSLDTIDQSPDELHTSPPSTNDTQHHSWVMSDDATSMK